MEIKLTRKRALYLLIFISFMVILTTTFSSCHTFTENFGPFKDIFKKKNVGVTSLNKKKDKLDINKKIDENVKYLKEIINKNKKDKEDNNKDNNKNDNKINIEEKNRNDFIKKTRTIKPQPYLPKSELGAKGSCKFLGSSACSKEFPVYMGASLGVPDNSGVKLSCNSDLVKSAKGIAKINNRKLEAIVLLDKGEGYKTPPKITISGGNGKGAKCSATLDEEGAIKEIHVENPGYNYTGTPEVNIELPSVSSSCHLCCKKIY